MADYGHELAFGIFPSPEATRAQATLALAQIADVTGLDLVTIQDHPYQSRHLDTWTLLSVIAARTSAVRVAANVTNLPLRPPVVLARSIATLDRLSGGRVELGLGTGAFWEGIVAAGGPRLSAGKSVDALGEAMVVIRGVWDGDGQPVRVEGEHYRVVGLHPGPSPAHDVEIWLGAYRPRMLRLTGSSADGWLPSMGYLPPDALPRANALIDEAALEAGRTPADIRRLYNVNGRFAEGAKGLHGSPSDWAEQLATLVLDHGMSTFILATDDPDDVRRYAAQVAPAVRELVAQERSRPTPGGPGGTGGPSGTGDGPPTRHGVLTAAAPEATAQVPLAAAALQVHPTPDDGARLTGPLPWDEPSRPHALVPETASYTAEQQAVPQHLVDVHDGLRGELSRLRDVVEQVARGQRDAESARSLINQMALRQNDWTLGSFCAAYCRIVTGHHSLEDASIFPHLRRADPSLAPVIDRLEEEHEVIADALDQVDRALVAMVSHEDDPSARHGPGGVDGLSRVIDLVSDLLLSHLAYEERELLHPLARHGFS